MQILCKPKKTEVRKKKGGAGNSKKGLTKIIIYDTILRSDTEGYRSGHNEAVLKSSFVGLCNLSKTLVFTDFFEGSIARCEKHFSQFSRKNHAFFSHFRMTFEKIVVGSSDNLIHFGGILKWLKSPVLKTNCFLPLALAKTLDFTGVFASFDARCEMSISQFSRNFTCHLHKFLI